MAKHVELPFPKTAVYTNGMAFLTKNKRAEKRNEMDTEIKHMLNEQKKEVKRKWVVH